MIGLVSCGGGSGSNNPPPAGGDTFTEGSRLKARWQQAPGAPRMLVGWYDTQLRINCSFSPAYSGAGVAHQDGGDFYCLPSLNSGAGDLFADAACTQPAADVGCDNWLVELPATAESCDAKDRFFSAGDPIASASIFVKNSDGCLGIAAAGRALPVSARKLGAEVPLASFVHARLTVDSGSARIVRRIMSADDGSSQVWGAWDNVRGEAVFAPDWANLAPAIGPGKWQPERVVPFDRANDLFAEAGCTQPAAIFDACGSVSPKSVFHVESDSCTSIASYFEAGPDLTAGEVYNGSPGACRAAPAETTDRYRFVAVGAAIAPSSFADVRSVTQGSGRARVATAGTDTAVIGGDHFDYLVDGQTGERCMPVTGADGTLRCMPEISTFGLYSDAGCSVQLFAWSGDTGTTCPVPAPSMISIPETVASDGCGQTDRWHGFPVGPVHDGVVYAGAPGSCAALDATTRSTFVAYELGSELPAASFIELATSNPF